MIWSRALLFIKLQVEIFIVYITDLLEKQLFTFLKGLIAPLSAIGDSRADRSRDILKISWSLFIWLSATNFLGSSGWVNNMYRFALAQEIVFAWYDAYRNSHATSKLKFTTKLCQVWQSINNLQVCNSSKNCSAMNTLLVNWPLGVHATLASITFLCQSGPTLHETLANITFLCQSGQTLYETLVSLGKLYMKHLPI